MGILQRFENGGAPSIIYNIILWLYTGVALLWGGLMLLINVPHTYFWNLRRPGTLFSLRYHSMLSIVLILSGLKLFFPIYARALVRFRKSRECNAAWSVLMGVGALLDIFIFLYVASQYAGANQPGSFYNMCNDPGYCCPFWEDIHCNRDRPCSSPVILITELARAGLCNWAFIVSGVSVALSLGLLLWTIVAYIKGEDAEEEEEEEEEPEWNRKQQKPNVRTQTRWVSRYTPSISNSIRQRAVIHNREK